MFRTFKNLQGSWEKQIRAIYQLKKTALNLISKQVRIWGTNRYNLKALLIFKWESNVPDLNWQANLVPHQMICIQQS